MTPETKPSAEVPLDLPWETTCRLACSAMIYGKSFDEIVERILRNYLRHQGAI